MMYIAGFTLGMILWNYIFILLPDIPGFPAALSTNIDLFLDLVFDNAGLIGFFVPLTVVKILIPLVIIVINFEWIYNTLLWIVKKIPLLNIK